LRLNFKQTERDSEENMTMIYLRNLSCFATTGLADDDGGGVSLDEVEDGSAVLVNRQSLALLVDIRVTVRRPLRPWLPELRHRSSSLALSRRMCFVQTRVQRIFNGKKGEGK
jgi:hypothetical protein